MRLLHGSNVEIVTPNLKICQSKNDFAEHVSQFGSKYVQYCFCTKEALKELTKE